MKKTFLIVSILFCTLTAFAEMQPYVAIRGGLERTQLNINDSEVFSTNTPLLGTSLGAQLNDIFRVELAYTFKHTKNDFVDNRDTSGIPASPSKEKIIQHTVLVNTFAYFFKEVPHFNPFVGAGVGVGFTDIEFAGGSSGFVYALYLGTDYALNKNWMLEAMGTFNNVTGLYVSDSSLKNYGATVGVRYNF